MIDKEYQNWYNEIASKCYMRVGIDCYIYSPASIQHCNFMNCPKKPKKEGEKHGN